MPARDGSRYQLRIGNDPAPFFVTAAVSPEALQKGLSGRPDLPSGQGLLFVFKDLAHHSMWMPDMHFALDIVWLDETMTVLSVHQNVPPCQADPCPSFVSPFLALYAIEMRAGDAMAYGFTPSTQVRVAAELNGA